MDKTIKINLAGTLFQIDEEAYRILRDYLHSINARFRNVHGGNETIDDIEARIAEIFQSQRGMTGVISKENVEAMIGILGKPEDFDINENSEYIPGPLTNRRRLYRNPDDSIISGVCGGIGAYMNIDPVWVRIVFILFAFSFGIGFFAYILLWIALPQANSDSQKRELYGEAFHSEAFKSRENREYNTPGEGGKRYSGRSANNIGSTFNEIFRAIWKFIFIFFRIFVILIGIALVMTGFVTLLSIIMVFFFKNPGVLLPSFGGNFFYLPDFLNYIVNPALTPWIIFLTIMVVALPLLAIIYWGIKMIFWFRSRDGIVSLVGFILWVLSLTALSLLLANEGFSFAETGRTTSAFVLENAPDTLYITTDRKVKDLKYDREINLPDESYSVFTNNEKHELSVRTKLRLYTAEDNSVKVDVCKRSNGRSRLDANERAESLAYNYRIENDTLFLDEYFTLPPEHKWGLDEVYVKLYVPEGTILHFDRTSENLFNDHIIINGSRYSDYDSWEIGNKYWIITEEGLEKAGNNKIRK